MTEQTTMAERLATASMQRVLYPMARRLGIPGYVEKRKGDLVAALLAHPDCQAAYDAETGAILHPAPVTESPGDDEVAQALRTILAARTRSAPVDETAVRLIAEEVATEKIRAAMEGAAVAVTVNDARTERSVSVGAQHARFPILLKVCDTFVDGKRMVPWLGGPPGTGKTTAARSVAKALDLSFAFTGALDSPYALSGFIDAGGRTVRTAFREAWENGGVFLFDEIDASHASAVVAFNAALANGVCAFPDGMVERHPDNVCIAAANTFGQGGNANLAGRVRQDGAFLDRFAMIHWNIDPALESAICPDKRWLRTVRATRKAATDRSVTGATITPRASVKGAALLANGVAFDDVCEMALRCGLPDASWEPLLSVARSAWGES